MSYFARSNELPEWALHVPDAWGSDWLKWSVDLSTKHPEQQEILPYISNEDIASWTGKLLIDEPKPAEAGGRVFRTNDILLNKLRPYLAKVYHATFDGVSSSELLCLRPSQAVEPRFLFYVLVSKCFIDTINSETFGSKMPRADWEIIGHQPLPLPPLATQRRIAQFLDEKTARIDGLIEKKRELLDRLAEKRQALITRAVTKGLNPDAPMKPSGIDWLGEIRLKFTSTEPLKYGANAAAEFDNPDWPRFVRITDVDPNGRLRDETFRSLPPEVAEPFLLHEGDILLARSGATVGKSLIYQEDWGNACFAGYFIRLRASDNFNARFIYWHLQSSKYWADIDLNLIQSTIQNVSAERYASFVVPKPPLAIQQRIARFLDEKTARIDGLIERIWESIAQLEEYRTAQITAAVTGQLAGFR